MLKPLQQFICDTCEEIIESPKDGYLEWVHADGKAHSFHIVHHASRSPRKPGGDCYNHTAAQGRADVALVDFVGTAGLPRLLSFLDMGALHDPDRVRLMRIKDVREFVELMRRLSLPFYEEARLYWQRAVDDRFFDGVNEVWPYRSDHLQQLIKDYGDG